MKQPKFYFVTFVTSDKFFSPESLRGGGKVADETVNVVYLMNLEVRFFSKLQSTFQFPCGNDDFRFT